MSGGKGLNYKPGRPSAKELSKRWDVQMLAQRHTKAALKALVDVVKDAGAPHAARVSAAGVLLDRGYGKAPQDLNVRGTIEQHIVELVMGLDDIPSAGDQADEQHTLQ